MINMRVDAAITNLKTINRLLTQKMSEQGSLKLLQLEHNFDFIFFINCEIQTEVSVKGK